MKIGTCFDMNSRLYKGNKGAVLCRDTAPRPEGWQGRVPGGWWKCWALHTQTEMMVNAECRAEC